MKICYYLQYLRLDIPKKFSKTRVFSQSKPLLFTRAEILMNFPWNWSYLFVFFSAIEDGVPLVELCDTSTDDDVYINYLFVQKGFANSTGIRCVVVVFCQR